MTIYICAGNCLRGIFSKCWGGVRVRSLDSGVRGPGFRGPGPGFQGLGPGFQIPEPGAWSLGSEGLKIERGGGL